MSTIVREEKYIKSDVNNNNNKWWTVQLLDSGDVVTSWGRVGDTGQSKTFPGAGVGFLEKKCREKESYRNGEIPYRKLNVISSSGVATTTTKTVTDAALKEVAKKQIKTNNPIVTRLIEYLAKVNAHQIGIATGGKITYNDTTGLFSTPLGIVTQDNIDSANTILTEIGDLVAQKFYNDKLLQKTNDYNMLIPCDFGHKRLDLGEFWSGLDKVQAQKQVLDGLQASLVQATSAPISAGKTLQAVEQNVFNVSLDVVNDISLVNSTFDNYIKMRSHQHQSSHLKPKAMWSVKIQAMHDAFQSYGSKLKNIISGYHGSGSENLLSLLKSGILIRPPSSAYVSGKMFGPGAYTAPCHVHGSSTKAANYSIGYWGGSRKDRIFLLICDVAMGNYYIPPSPCSGVPKGYDSCWAKGNHRSGVLNDECVVYKANQLNIKYLVELE